MQRGIDMRNCLVVAVWILSAAAAAQEPLVPANATVRLGPHTWAIPDQGIGGVPNVGIVIGENATLVIDPGLGRRNGETVLSEVAKISDNADLYIATTHFHPEHTTGYVAFPESAVYVNSRIQEAEFAERGMATIERFSSFGPVFADLLSDAGRRTADITFDREYRLDLGGVTVQFHVVGPTHTGGDTGFFVAEDRVLFSGDVVMNSSFLAAFPESSISAWLAAFDTFDALGPTTIVPSHGAIGDGSLLRQQREAVEGIRNRAVQLRREGVSEEAAGQIVQDEMQAMHPDWPRVNRVAILARSAWREAE
jgi:glyoxylase-like metal-dependent hydrolase (beta-lactamase superfamily II)